MIRFFVKYAKIGALFTRTSLQFEPNFTDSCFAISKQQYKCICTHRGLQFTPKYVNDRHGNTGCQVFMLCLNNFQKTDVENQNFVIFLRAAYNHSIFQRYYRFGRLKSEKQAKYDCLLLGPFENASRLLLSSKRL